MSKSYRPIMGICPVKSSHALLKEISKAKVPEYRCTILSEDGEVVYLEYDSETMRSPIITNHFYIEQFASLGPWREGFLNEVDGRYFLKSNLLIRMLKDSYVTSRIPRRLYRPIAHVFACLRYAPYQIEERDLKQRAR